MKPSDLSFKLLRGMLRILSQLPTGVLYGLSSMLSPVVHHLVRYRLGVVRDNLAKCFSELTEKERRHIEKAFYLNFTDYAVETLKLMHISDSEMEQRMTFSGLEHMTEPLAKGKDVLIYFSHCGNWEWAPSVTLHCPREADGREIVYGQVYRPLRDAAFDALMLELRGRFGSKSFAKTQVLRDLLVLRREGRASVTGFMSDQKPSHGDPLHITSFLGRPTAFISGTETLARKLDMAVVYWDMEKPRRGHYHIQCRPLSASAASAEKGEITERYVRLLEATIRRRPDLWLWSHNRWKNPLPPTSPSPSEQ
ncbi:MAG: lysophospholipid acyltransferase family protein [Muribaculaceae bacterium]|nr:lysophospholipid acyltransferase family protein [Muribaculaceae bacterium]